MKESANNRYIYSDWAHSYISRVTSMFLLSSNPRNCCHWWFYVCYFFLFCHRRRIGMEQSRKVCWKLQLQALEALSNSLLSISNMKNVYVSSHSVSVFGRFSTDLQKVENEHWLNYWMERYFSCYAGNSISAFQPNGSTIANSTSSIEVNKNNNQLPERRIFLKTN